MELSFRGCLLLFLKASLLLSKDEAGTINENEATLLRMITPLAKLFTAKECMKVCSEGVEFFGGVG